MEALTILVEGLTHRMGWWCSPCQIPQCVDISLLAGCWSDTQRYWDPMPAEVLIFKVLWIAAHAQVRPWNGALQWTHWLSLLTTFNENWSKKKNVCRKHDWRFWVDKIDPDVCISSWLLVRAMLSHEPPRWEIGQISARLVYPVLCQSLHRLQVNHLGNRASLHRKTACTQPHIVSQTKSAHTQVARLFPLLAELGLIKKS